MFPTSAWYWIFLAGPALAAPAPHHVELVDRQTACSVAESYPTVDVAELPNPFVTAAGANITTKAAFDCRAQEISKIFQQYELGDYPGPADAVTGTLSGSTLTVAVTVAGRSVSYAASVSKPSSGSGPFPAIITIGGASIPIPAGVATINFNNDDFAAQVSSSSRGTGKFFTLFGANHSAGALTAWAWGVDRLIDVRGSLTPFLPTSLPSPPPRSRSWAFLTGALLPRLWSRSTPLPASTLRASA